MHRVFLALAPNLSMKEITDIVMLRNTSKSCDCECKLLSRVKHNQGGLGFHLLWPFNEIVNLPAFECGTQCGHYLQYQMCTDLSSTRSFPIIWVYIWLGYCSIEIKDIKISWVGEAQLILFLCTWLYMLYLAYDVSVYYDLLSLNSKCFCILTCLLY